MTVGPLKKFTLINQNNMQYNLQQTSYWKDKAMINTGQQFLK